MESYSESYRKSGVDITAGYAGVKLMAPTWPGPGSPGSVRHWGLWRVVRPGPDRHT